MTPFEIGDVVDVETWSGGTRRVLVIGKSEKDGRPTGHGNIVQATEDDDLDDGVWFYNDQVLRVVRMEVLGG
jgi:hypothetical protein